MLKRSLFALVLSVIPLSAAQAYPGHHHRHGHHHGSRGFVSFGMVGAPYYPAPAPVIYSAPPPVAYVQNDLPPAPEPDRYCREYQRDVYIDGRRQPAYGTACQEPDGSWKLVD